ncbi:MAG: UbiA family prenyltransferase [Chitinophagaceae bacterium]|nr:UbiA family prenyltransferase [Chitinophagaceae bacterium]
MKLVKAFLQLVRWPNLVFIILTQLLFEYCIYQRIYGPVGAEGLRQFYFLVIASVCIAAAGNIINDYFDLNIDQINKPQKVVVNVIINRRWVIFWHMVLSMTGLFFTAYALPLSLYWHLVLANMACVVLLWVYSTNLKKQLLVGNLLISFLTGWVILILFLSKYPLTIHQLMSTGAQDARFFRLTALYAGFAFIISLVREVVKDMEDVEGDRRYGCRTMPIAWGINASKVFVAVWLIVLIASLALLQLYVIPLGWWHSALYCLLAIILPLLWIFRKLFKAQTPADYHKLSSAIKYVMLAGILSMVFFRIYP